jgi:hypothetical protein
MSDGPIDLHEVAKIHARLIESHTKMMDSEAADAAKHAENQVYQSPRFRPRTGRLQAATSGTVIPIRGGRRIVVRNTAKYAAPIDRGARPHLIRPRRAQALRFVARDGRIVFTRLVRHPGNKPYRFLWRATFSAYRIAGQGLQAGMQRVAARW